MYVGLLVFFCLSFFLSFFSVSGRHTHAKAANKANKPTFGRDPYQRSRFECWLGCQR
jgi:hypothetical protein